MLEQQHLVATLQERERLARELHDSTGQVLGYVNLQTQTIQKWLQSGNQERAEASLTRLAEVARDAHVDVRESILGLKTGPVQDWAFLSALKRYLNDFQEHYNIRTELSIPEGMQDDVITPGTGVQVLRVIQEALTNARKHSSAKTVRITFEQKDSRVFIRISDDGSGFNPDQLDRERNGHFGLIFMRERMEQAGGSLNIESSPGTGTTVQLEAPVRNK